MKFRTELKTNFIGDVINYQSRILTVGSCFADNIGNHLSEFGFSTTTNPFGIFFNPISIFDALDSALNQKINEDQFVERDGHWFHYDYHSDLTANTKEELRSKIFSCLEQTKNELLTCDVLIVTLGTAWIYKHLKANQYVANCHKMPQTEFEKELIHLESLKNWCHTFFVTLFEKNKNLKVILSVSPVRHIKDGLHENNLSKSVLHLLSNFLNNNFENIIYFPAYELVIDDLRDYRFYKEDLIHPTEQAIEYVFEKFSESYFSEKTKRAVEIKSSILKAENHRFLNATESEKENHQKLIEKLKADFEKSK